ncbi:hypothetical protein LY76DRAFT_421198 [Colletotrichum caudatum]|nr:hypothetical protein LY76DRAFT_421198 [Colletotrichum caudatum]
MPLPTLRSNYCVTGNKPLDGTKTPPVHTPSQTQTRVWTNEKPTCMTRLTRIACSPRFCCHAHRPSKNPIAVAVVLRLDKRPTVSIPFTLHPSTCTSKHHSLLSFLQAGPPYHAYTISPSLYHIIDAGHLPLFCRQRLAACLVNGAERLAAAATIAPSVEPSWP